VSARIKVMVATPLRHFRSNDDLPPQIGRMLRELYERRAEHEYEFEFAAACGGLCSARNRLVHEFLFKSECTILKWHDADLHDEDGKDADHLLTLLNDARANGCHVMGGLYPKREKRPRWVANWLHSAKVQDGKLQVVELGMGDAMYSKTVLMEIRRIFGEIPLQTPETAPQSIMYRDRETGEMVAGFHQIGVIEGDLLSEDFFLNYLCRCAKIPIWAHTGLRSRQVDGADVYPAKGDAWPPIPAEVEA
jgi:hypothetical protein